MSDPNKLDLMIRDNIIEARGLWLDTLPPKAEIPPHPFTLRFRCRIRRMAGMKYTLLHICKLMALGLLPAFLGFFPQIFAAVPLAPFAFFSLSHDAGDAILAAAAAPMLSPLLVWFLLRFWHRAGEWARSREVASPLLTTLLVLVVPSLFILRYNLMAAPETLEGVAQSIWVFLFAIGLPPYLQLMGYYLFHDLFFANGMLLWLGIVGGVFYAGCRNFSLRRLTRPLCFAGFFAGLYESLVHLEYTGPLFDLCKLGYLIGIVCALYLLLRELGLSGGWLKLLTVGLILAALLLLHFDLSMERQVPRVALLEEVNCLQDILPELSGSRVYLRVTHSIAADEQYQYRKWARPAYSQGVYIEPDANTAQVILRELSALDLRNFRPEGSFQPEILSGITAALHLTYPDGACDLYLNYNSLSDTYYLGIGTTDGASYLFSGTDELPVRMLDGFEKQTYDRPAPDALLYPSPDSSDGKAIGKADLAILLDIFDHAKTYNGSIALIPGCRLYADGVTYTIDTKQGLFHRSDTDTIYSIGSYKILLLQHLQPLD